MHQIELSVRHNTVMLAVLRRGRRESAWAKSEKKKTTYKTGGDLSHVLRAVKIVRHSMGLVPPKPL